MRNILAFDVNMKYRRAIVLKGNPLQVLETWEFPHFSTMRYVDNALREAFDIGPAPIKLWAVASQDPRRGD